MHSYERLLLIIFECTATEASAFQSSSGRGGTEAGDAVYNGAAAGMRAYNRDAAGRNTHQPDAVAAASAGASSSELSDSDNEPLNPSGLVFFLRAMDVKSIIIIIIIDNRGLNARCLLYTSPSPRDRQKSRMPSSA